MEGDETQDTVEAATHGVESSVVNATELAREPLRFTGCVGPPVAVVGEVPGDFSCRRRLPSTFVCLVGQAPLPPSDARMPEPRFRTAPSRGDAAALSDEASASTAINGGEAASILVRDIPDNMEVRGNCPPFAVERVSTR